MPPATIGIGDFAKATHLTIKTLRHYHRIGLLEPAQVDEITGYRRYGTDQIRQALIISRFRKLDMPLDTIHEVLAAPDLATRNAAIAAHLERLETALEHTRSAAQSLRDLLGRAEPLPATIEHLAVPATETAAITATIDADDDTIPWVLGALGELRATVAAQHVTVTGLAGGIYADELFTEARGEATLFLPCTGEIRPAGRVKSGDRPGRRARDDRAHGPPHGSRPFVRRVGCLCCRTRAGGTWTDPRVLPHRPCRHARSRTVAHADRMADLPDHTVTRAPTGRTETRARSPARTSVTNSDGAS
jgi:DNA-binding transcriptional MerR regulator